MWSLCLSWCPTVTLRRVICGRRKVAALGGNEPCVGWLLCDASNLVPVIAWS